MIRSGWRNAPLRRLLVVSAVALLPVLAGCEAGDSAPTLDFHYPTDATGTVAGDISIRNVFIVGAPLGSSLKPGESASLFFSLINNGAPDRLLSISAPGSAASVHLSGGTVPVVAMQPVYWNGPQPEAYLVHITRVITGGSDLTLDLYFQNEGKVTLQVPVFAATAHYATYSPPPSPTATVTTTSKHKHGASATPTPTPTPTPSPTPTT